MMLKGRNRTTHIKRQQTKSYNYFQPEVDVLETPKLPVFEMKQKPYDDSDVIKAKANALAIKDNIKDNLKLKQDKPSSARPPPRTNFINNNQ